jgi:DNA-binding transcriptional LysR family regulator
MIALEIYGDSNCRRMNPFDGQQRKNLRAFASLGRSYWNAVPMLEIDFLEPERLRAFLAVAETGSFSRAARRLHLTQSAVSTQVRRLEESIGRPLLDRGPQSAKLNKDGETMLGYARTLLETIKQARNHFAEPALEGSVRLGIVEDFSGTALPQLLGQLMRTHSRFELSIATGTSADLSSRLQENQFDLVLSKRLVGGTQGKLLCRQPYVWVGAPSLVSEKSVVPLVTYLPGTVPRELMLQSLRRGKHRWSIRFESGSYAGLRAGVLAGIGVSAFPVGMIPPDVRTLPSATLPPLDNAELILERNPRSDSTAITVLVDILGNTIPTIIARLEDEQTIETT